MKDQEQKMLEAADAAMVRAEASGFDATADVFRRIRDQLMREFKCRGQLVGRVGRQEALSENSH